MSKHVLGLVLPTDPRWVNIAEKNIEEVLVDHAYCEQKAASSCISLIISYPEKEAMVAALTPIVAEEWAHFTMVLDMLKKRGMKLGHARKDKYVEELMKLVRKGGNRDQQLVEKLLLNALIEARSCERFRLLSLELKDESLRAFYHELMVSEAGHYKCFLSLAKEYMQPEIVERRWRELLSQEALVMNAIGVRNKIH